MKAKSDAIGLRARQLLAAKGYVVSEGDFYVKHRTAQEMSGSGYKPPSDPWKYDGPFDTYAAAKKHWDKIHLNWQEGGVVVKCGHCGSYVPAPRRAKAKR